MRYIESCGKSMVALGLPLLPLPLLGYYYSGAEVTEAIWVVMYLGCLAVLSAVANFAPVAVPTILLVLTLLTINQGRRSLLNKAGILLGVAVLYFSDVVLVVPPDRYVVVLRGQRAWEVDLVALRIPFKDEVVRMEKETVFEVKDGSEAYMGKVRVSAPVYLASQAGKVEFEPFLAPYPFAKWIKIISLGEEVAKEILRDGIRSGNPLTSAVDVALAKEIYP